MAKEIEPAITKGKFTKLVLLLVLVVGGFVVGMFMNVNQPKSQVLGAKTERVTATPVPTVANVNLVDTAKQTGEGILKSAQSKSQDLKSQVLGAVTQIVSATASKSASAVSEFLLRQTVPKIVNQIEKLPEPQREAVKKNILDTLKSE